jgi:hypothetical protein
MPNGIVPPAIAAEVAAPFEQCETTQAGNFIINGAVAQNGAYGEPGGIYTSGQPFDRLLVQPLPGAQRTIIPVGGGLTRIGATEVNQYHLTMSVSGSGHPSTFVVTPQVGDCLNNVTAPVAPNVSLFQVRSRQRMVVSTGQDPNAYTASFTLVAVAPGITEVTVTQFRNVNAQINGSAVPSGTEGTQCSIIVRVLS